ncbi:ABC transporter ATP-binding protein [Rhodopirellula baltica]|uniref:ABC transporter ATP binding protein n=1 Tax=Rhodopirellula baltica WH47 TaxID=991778 RepID=F2AV19_RHOBT|nr:ABC transporter ATP-binding protein [Rhodopirellula baltica]EGF26511.1 ABC transporter ATP binding protein [Rhodopirellula baltica WH47]
MNPVISTDQLTMRFRGCDALLGVDLNIQPGTVFALLGENGAGKTTLIRILTGFQKPTSGSASVCDFDPLKQPLEVRRRVGYVSDNPALYDWMTVGQIGWFTASFYPDGFYEAYRESVAKYEIPEDRKIRVLSKGQRAKIALSLALAHDPELLILDEPTSGLDPMVRREFLESMIGRAASGRTVFLSSHQINEVERVADTIGILHNGKLQACEPLNDLKGSMTELTVSLDDPLVELPTLPEPAQTLLEENQGRQRRVMVRHFDSSMISHIESAEGVTGVRERAMSLEEIFIAHTRKGFFRPADPPEGSHASSRQSDDPEGGGSQSDSEVLSTGERS